MRLFQPNHLYAQVRDEIARRIAREDYPPGSLLPNEFVLANEMQVSVGTLRKALEQLDAEKLISRSQGRGTVVADRRSADYRSKFDRIRNANGSYVTWRFRALHMEVLTASEEEQRVLRLGRSDQIISIRRLREVGGKVVKQEHARLPFALFGPLEGLEAHETVVESLVFAKGLHMSSSEERVTVVPAPENVAEAFDLPEGTIVLRLDRLVIGGSGEPMEWRIAYCHLGDRQYHAPSPLGARPMKESPMLERLRENFS